MMLLKVFFTLVTLSTLSSSHPLYHHNRDPVTYHYSDNEYLENTPPHKTQYPPHPRVIKSNPDPPETIIVQDDEHVVYKKNGVFFYEPRQDIIRNPTPILMEDVLAHDVPHVAPPPYVEHLEIAALLSHLEYPAETPEYAKPVFKAPMYSDKGEELRPIREVESYYSGKPKLVYSHQVPDEYGLKELKSVKYYSTQSEGDLQIGI